MIFLGAAFSAFGRITHKVCSGLVVLFEASFSSFFFENLVVLV